MFNIRKWKEQKGEIVTVLTLISLGVLLVGIIAGRQLVRERTSTQPKAADVKYLCTLQDYSASGCPDDKSVGAVTTECVTSPSTIVQTCQKKAGENIWQKRTCRVDSSCTLIPCQCIGGVCTSACGGRSRAQCSSSQGDAWCQAGIPACNWPNPSGSCNSYISQLSSNRCGCSGRSELGVTAKLNTCNSTIASSDKPTLDIWYQNEGGSEENHWAYVKYFTVNWGDGTSDTTANLWALKPYQGQDTVSITKSALYTTSGPKTVSIDAEIGNTKCGGHNYYNITSTTITVLSPPDPTATLTPTRTPTPIPDCHAEEIQNDLTKCNQYSNLHGGVCAWYQFSSHDGSCCDYKGISTESACSYKVTPTPTPVIASCSGEGASQNGTVINPNGTVVSGSVVTFTAGSRFSPSDWNTGSRYTYGANVTNTLCNSPCTVTADASRGSTLTYFTNISHTYDKAYYCRGWDSLWDPSAPSTGSVCQNNCKIIVNIVTPTPTPTGVINCDAFTSTWNISSITPNYINGNVGFQINGSFPQIAVCGRRYSGPSAFSMVYVYKGSYGVEEKSYYATDSTQIESYDESKIILKPIFVYTDGSNWVFTIWYCFGTDISGGKCLIGSNALHKIISITNPVTGSPTPTPTPTPVCPAACNYIATCINPPGRNRGDADCNCHVDENDFGIWLYQYQDSSKTAPLIPLDQRTANFNCVTGQDATYKVDTNDFDIWKTNYGKY